MKGAKLIKFRAVQITRFSSIFAYTCSFNNIFEQTFTPMKVTINRLDKNFYLEAKNEEGKTVYMDAAEKIGGTNKAARPMQLLLMALGGCSSFDVIHILNKQKLVIDDLNVEVEGQREEVIDGGAAEFNDITVVYSLKGELPPEKVIRAVELSMEKYCSVSKTLEHTATIKYKINLNGEEIYSK
jgi:putative redox protein